MRVAVVSITDGKNERADGFASSWWRWALPGVEEFMLDDGSNLDRMVQEAKLSGVDVVILADSATVFAPVTEVLDAVQGAYATRRLHVLASLSRELTNDEAECLIAGKEVPVDGEVQEGYFGIAVDVDSYWDFGGADNRLRSSDLSYLVAAADAFSGVDYHNGLAFRLRSPESSADADEQKLRARYAGASGNAFAMQQLIEERQSHGSQGVLWPLWSL